MRDFKAGLWFCFAITSLAGQRNTLFIPHASSDIAVDGRLDDWDSLPTIIPGAGQAPYKNTNRVALTWNEDFLYVLFRIQDHQLCAHETGNNNPRLYFNDGVEIYLDTKADSDSIMDKNDYQFLIALPQYSIVFRGDKFLLKQGHQVPKDAENHTVIFSREISFSGTINQLEDNDDGYVVEAAIPWSTLGLIPKQGLPMKIDLCVNDIDTLVDMAAMPEDWHPPSMNYINMQSKSDFGFPRFWTQAVLTGSPGLMYNLKQRIEGYGAYFLGGFVLLICLGGWTIYRLFKKIRFYRNFPTRQESWDITSQHSGKEAVLNGNESPSQTTSPEVPESIFILRKYIENHLEDEIRLDDLCRHIHVGHRQLQRLTKEHCGMSPMQWVNVLKMEEAAKRLRETSKNINEIAMELAFEDAAYFSQLFKKYHGVSPARFRKLTS